MKNNKNFKEHPLLAQIYNEYKDSQFKDEMSFKDYLNIVNWLDKFEALKEIAYYSNPWRKILSIFWIYFK